MRFTPDQVRAMSVAVRSITSPPDVRMQIVRASDPDTIEAEFPGLF